MDNTVIAIYKGKMLLSSQDNYHDLSEKSVWSFVDTRRLSQIGIKKTEITSYTNSLHYIKLNDSQVFGILREGGNRLEFYKPSEMDSILLTQNSQQIYAHFKEDINKIIKINPINKSWS